MRLIIWWIFATLIIIAIGQVFTPASASSKGNEREVDGEIAKIESPAGFDAICLDSIST